MIDGSPKNVDEFHKYIRKEDDKREKIFHKSVMFDGLAKRYNKNKVDYFKAAWKEHAKNPDFMTSTGAIKVLDKIIDIEMSNDGQFFSELDIKKASKMLSITDGVLAALTQEKNFKEFFGIGVVFFRNTCGAISKSFALPGFYNKCVKRMEKENDSGFIFLYDLTGIGVLSEIIYKLGRPYVGSQPPIPAEEYLGWIFLNGDTKSIFRYTTKLVGFLGLLYVQLRRVRVDKAVDEIFIELLDKHGQADYELVRDYINKPENEGNFRYWSNSTLMNEVNRVFDEFDEDFNGILDETEIHKFEDVRHCLKFIGSYTFKLFVVSMLVRAIIYWYVDDWRLKFLGRTIMAVCSYLSLVLIFDNMEDKSDTTEIMARMAKHYIEEAMKNEETFSVDSFVVVQGASQGVVDIEAVRHGRFE